MSASVAPSILIVLSSTTRRGSEVAGSALAGWLRQQGLGVGLVALAAPRGVEIDAVDAVLGRSSLGWSTLWALRRRARRFDIVIAYGARASPACALALVGTAMPLVHRYIGDPVYWEGGRLRRWRRRWMFRRAAGVVALWPGAAATIAALYDIPPSAVVAIPNGRDDTWFRPPTPEERRDARAAIGLDESVTAVAVVGALEPEKRVERAIAAVAALPDAHLLVVGDGDERPRLEAVADPDRTTFCGVVDDVRAMLWTADALVSTSETEGMAGVIVEAAMCGVPVVATAVGAAADGEFDDIALLVPPEATAAEITAAIRSAIGTPPAAASVTNRFSWSEVGARWRTYLESLAAERTPRSRR